MIKNLHINTSSPSKIKNNNNNNNNNNIKNNNKEDFTHEKENSEIIPKTNQNVQQEPKNLNKKTRKEILLKRKKEMSLQLNIKNCSFSSLNNIPFPMRRSKTQASISAGVLSSKSCIGSFLDDDDDEEEEEEEELLNEQQQKQQQQQQSSVGMNENQTSISRRQRLKKTKKSSSSNNMFLQSPLTLTEDVFSPGSCCTPTTPSFSVFGGKNLLVLPTKDYSFFCQDCQCISELTFFKIFHNPSQFKDLQKVFIIDCRCPFEFNGGHLPRAINMTSPQNLINLLFKSNSENNKFNNCKYTPRYNQNTVFIFHCEFSQKRGPKNYRFLRQLDRKLNENRYPYLYYPNIYILDEGYKNIFEYIQKIKKNNSNLLLSSQNNINININKMDIEKEDKKDGVDEDNEDGDDGDEDELLSPDLSFEEFQSEIDDKKNENKISLSLKKSIIKNFGDLKYTPMNDSGFKNTCKEEIKSMRKQWHKQKDFFGIGGFGTPFCCKGKIHHKRRPLSRSSSFSSSITSKRKLIFRTLSANGHGNLFSSPFSKSKSKSKKKSPLTTSFSIPSLLTSPKNKNKNNNKNNNNNNKINKNKNKKKRSIFEFNCDNEEEMEDFDFGEELIQNKRYSLQGNTKLIFKQQMKKRKLSCNNLHNLESNSNSNSNETLKTSSPPIPMKNKKKKEPLVFQISSSSLPSSRPISADSSTSNCTEDSFTSFFI